MEHLVVILDGLIQKIPASLIQGTSILTIFFNQQIRVWLDLIGTIAVNGSYAELSGRVSICFWNS